MPSPLPGAPRPSLLPWDSNGWPTGAATSQGKEPPAALPSHSQISPEPLGTRPSLGATLSWWASSHMGRNHIKTPGLKNVPTKGKTVIRGNLPSPTSAPSQGSEHVHSGHEPPWAWRRVGGGALWALLSSHQNGGHLGELWGAPPAMFHSWGFLTRSPSSGQPRR